MTASYTSLLAVGVGRAPFLKFFLFVASCNTSLLEHDTARICAFCLSVIQLSINHARSTLLIFSAGSYVTRREMRQTRKDQVYATDPC